MANRLTWGRRSWCRLFGAALALLALAVVLPQYATAERRNAQPAPPETATLDPVLRVIPAPDGQSVLVQAGGLGELSGRVSTNLRLGPSGNKGSYTMVYSDTAGLYEVVVPGFPVGMTASATVEISTTAGLRSAELPMARGFLPADQLGAVTTDDGLLHLQVINLQTLPGSPYVAANASPAPPAPPPPGLRIVGHSYSLRDSGSLGQSARPMSLRLGYRAADLGETDPLGLAIYAWDEPAKTWERVESTVFADQAYVSAPITRFTFYALMAEQPVERDVRVFLPLLRR